MDNEFTGLILDPRTPEEKDRDYKHENIFPASSTPVEWVEKKEYRFYDLRNQDYSSSCMAHSGVKMLGIENKPFVTLSARPIYKARSNNSGGMYHQECAALLCKELACLESELKSNGLNEDEINAPFTMTELMKESARKYKATKYVFLPIDMDKIAEQVDKFKGVQIILYFLGDEYWKEVPTVRDTTLKYWEDRASRHGVTIVDRILYNGKKAFVVEDSAGNGTSIKKNGKRTGQRILTEDFFMARCYGACYLTKEIPSELIIPTLRNGQRGEMIKKLQSKLNSLGFNSGAVDGIFGKNTLRAVTEFQKSKGLVPDGIVGKLTAGALNK